MTTFDLSGFVFSVELATAGSSHDAIVQAIACTAESAEDIQDVLECVLGVVAVGALGDEVSVARSPFFDGDEVICEIRCAEESLGAYCGIVGRVLRQFSLKLESNFATRFVVASRKEEEMLLNRKFGEVQLIPDVPSTAAWLGWLEGSEQGLVVRMVFDRVVSNRLFAFLERYLNDWWGVVYLGGFWPGSEELQFELIGDRELFRIAPRVVEFAAPWWIVHRSAMAALMNGLYSRTIFAFDEKLIEVEAE